MHVNIYICMYVHVYICMCVYICADIYIFCTKIFIFPNLLEYSGSKLKYKIYEQEIVILT